MGNRTSTLHVTINTNNEHSQTVPNDGTEEPSAPMGATEDVVGGGEPTVEAGQVIDKSEEISDDSSEETSDAASVTTESSAGPKRKRTRIGMSSSELKRQRALGRARDAKRTSERQRRDLRNSITTSLRTLADSRCPRKYKGKPHPNNQGLATTLDELFDHYDISKSRHGFGLMAKRARTWADMHQDPDKQDKVYEAVRNYNDKHRKPGTPAPRATKRKASGEEKRKAKRTKIPNPHTPMDGAVLPKDPKGDDDDGNGGTGAADFTGMGGPAIQV